MKRLRDCLAFLLAAAGGVQAAQLEVSVPVELARALARGGVFYRGLPPDFPSFAMPPGLSVIGSHALDNQQRVLLRSAPEGDEAQRAIAGALAREGWMELPEPGAARRNGFIIPDLGALRPLRLCHDAFGVMRVRGESGVENRVYLERLGVDRRPGRPGCEEQRRAALAPRPPRFPAPSAVSEFLPVLESPAVSSPSPDVPFGIARIGLGSGSGSREERESLVVAPDFSPAELLEHYAAQLREQDWERDAAWAGQVSAGGNWTRRVGNGDRLLATLRIVQASLDAFMIGGARNETAFSMKLVVRTLE